MGWYYCQCKPGYHGPIFDTNLGTSCVGTLWITQYSITALKQYFFTDIDECRDKTHTCHPTAECVNVDGGFQCECSRESLDCQYGCIFEGKEVAHGDTVRSKKNHCESCTCHKGVVSCEEPKCDCSKTVNDPCCPQCDPNKSCTHQELSTVKFMHGERLVITKIYYLWLEYFKIVWLCAIE